MSTFALADYDGWLRPRFLLGILVKDRKRHQSCVLYCEERGYEERIRALLEERFEVSTRHRWRDFLSASRTSPCAIVEAEDLASRRLKRNLFQFCIQPLLRPLVLITRFNDGNAQALKDLCVDEVVWLNRLDRELVSAVRGCERGEFMVALGNAIRRNKRLPRQLAYALEAACMSPVPFQSQKELFEFSRAHRTTLYRQWREIGGDGQSLKTVLDWMVLLRASLWHDAGQSWREVSESMGISGRRLSSIAERLAGRTLSEIDVADLEKRFRGTLVNRTLLGK